MRLDLPSTVRVEVVEEAAGNGGAGRPQPRRSNGVVATGDDEQELREGEVHPEVVAARVKAVAIGHANGAIGPIQGCL